ncbi:uncharacterized protein LOC143264394 [Megachile rotundata]|uniref:uncharacterized protein LOC143264394 n=1 Tax=Megachile rotundata TaxID=143995 RepID=UPI003FD62109
MMLVGECGCWYILKIYTRSGKRRGKRDRYKLRELEKKMKEGAGGCANSPSSSPKQEQGVVSIENRQRNWPQANALFSRELLGVKKKGWRVCDKPGKNRVEGRWRGAGLLGQMNI